MTVSAAGQRPERAPAWLQAALGIGKCDPGPAFDWHGRIAFVCALLTLLTFAFGIWMFTKGIGAIDFLAFWAAGRLTAAGHPALAYDYQIHRAVEMTVAHMKGPMPFSYPPPFLLVIMPFGFRPVWLAFLLWVSMTGGIYIAASRRLVPTTYALAQPAAFMNAVGGQNGFLSSGLFIAATSFVETRPWMAGALFGLFICKPQLAFLLPIALLAGRHWRSVIAAAAISAALLAIGLLAFGLESYLGFFAMARRFSLYLAAGRWRWEEMASVYAFARSIGAPNAIALALQSVTACLAALLTWQAWSSKSDQRAAVLAAGTLLVSPYLFTYDTLLMLIPIAHFVRKGCPWRVASLWTLCILSVVAGLELAPMPNLMPLAALTALWWLHSDVVEKHHSSRLLPA